MSPYIFSFRQADLISDLATAGVEFPDDTAEIKKERRNANHDICTHVKDCIEKKNWGQSFTDGTFYLLFRVILLVWIESVRVQ